MDPILLLALATFALVIAFLVWNRISVARQKAGTPPSGIGGPNDPLAGTTENMRHPDAMRASLDAATGADAPIGAAPLPRRES